MDKKAFKPTKRQEYVQLKVITGIQDKEKQGSDIWEACKITGVSALGWLSCVKSISVDNLKNGLR